MSQTIEMGFRERKRRATHERIAGEAARLVAGRGLDRTTVDQIAAAAEVGRATFFRYFDTKEGAVAAGFAELWLSVITDELKRQPLELSPLQAVRSAFASLARGFDEQRELVLLQAQLSRTSVTLQAWTLQLYVGFETAIAEILAPRFDDLRRADPRPRLIGALTMAVIRLALDTWVATDGASDLPALINRGLRAISIETASGRAGRRSVRSARQPVTRPGAKKSQAKGRS